MDGMVGMQQGARWKSVTPSRPGSIMKLRLHFVVDPMGWLCISVVFFIWLYNSFFIPYLVLLPHFREGHVSKLVVAGYYLASALCLVALFRASTTDPGRVPQNPHIPHSERDQWELCNKCNMMRPKRSHHCSRCGHCVRRMDHHCPCLFTLALDFCQYYYFQPLSKVDMEQFSSRHELALLRISTFMGLLMFGGMSGLFYTQITGILADTTTIEKMSHFMDQMKTARKPWQQTFAEVFGTHWKILWFLPFRRWRPLRDAYHFPSHFGGIIKGEHQFSKYQHGIATVYSLSKIHRIDSKAADRAMAGKAADGSIKWQLCYDMSARTWW
ncbi:palmitoyltransferase ZDHHC21-like, partial [Scleropages formosus]